MAQNILIVGATSGIARAVARQLALEKHHLLLAGRNMDDLDALAQDLRTRGDTTVHTIAFHATSFDQHHAFFQDCLDKFAGQLDTILLCHGVMPTQEQAETDLAQARLMIDVNFTSAVSLINLAAACFKPRKQGCIAALSSVAGDRGRQSNALYGASKAALSTYLAGMRNRLYPHGVSVITIKPGPTDTPMTAGLAGTPRLADPDHVASDIVKAIHKRRDIVYTPWKWRIIMAIIRSIPEGFFKRLKL